MADGSSPRNGDLGTQRAVILGLLRKYGEVSAHDLTYRAGITRAAARIHELRQQGHDIVTIREKGRQARYRLRPKPQVLVQTTAFGLPELIK